MNKRVSTLHEDYRFAVIYESILIHMSYSVYNTQNRSHQIRLETRQAELRLTIAEKLAREENVG